MIFFFTRLIEKEPSPSVKPVICQGSITSPLGDSVINLHFTLDLDVKLVSGKGDLVLYKEDWKPCSLKGKFFISCKENKVRSKQGR